MRTDIDGTRSAPGPTRPHPDPVHGAARRGRYHFHVVGDTFVEHRSYTPPPAPGTEYLKMLDATGMTYGVLIQVSVHGDNNSVMLDVLSNTPTGCAAWWHRPRRP